MWIDTFLRNKGVELDQEFTVEGESGTNFMSYGVVVQHIKCAPKNEYNQIKNMMIKLDFHNAPIEPFLKHLAQAIAQ